MFCIWEKIEKIVRSAGLLTYSSYTQAKICITPYIKGIFISTKQSASVYDIYGYIDYWTPDWSGYLPLEFFWRMTYTGGDPADPNNWQMIEPPTSAPEHQPGLRTIPGSTFTQSSRH